MSIAYVLAVIALIIALISGLTGRVPLWVAVVLLALAHLVPGLPLR
jgi:hypothetical protein